MDIEFWQQRWQENRIGFHRQAINPRLIQFWPSLNIAKSARVLVPLCGKSNDMHWLAEQGHEVCGFELSPIAVTEFFSDAALKPLQSTVGPYTCWQAPPYKIFQGDFFQAASLNQHFTAMYDRAALVALPNRLQPQYVALLAQLLLPGAQGVLITVHYAPEQQQTPPFSVSEAKVRELFAPYFSVQLCARHAESLNHPRAATDDIEFFDELSFIVIRNEQPVVQPRAE
ncbi:thiopurine S-methyltransferase [Oceanisphaera avium]|uniref:Thiopurine S-methyltransferase n=1 Tax=Oceanisphaera avium TaxID=1903694 RepID=A0A1Y0CW72_9GAMM|nr:thiopurine S-methyltransferase [Oceanisphaera avium]ART79147.1 thiopurine S-methyltransferase [Oceanisphaera avium]